MEHKKNTDSSGMTRRQLLVAAGTVGATIILPGRLLAIPTSSLSGKCHYVHHGNAGSELGIIL